MIRFLSCPDPSVSPSRCNASCRSPPPEFGALQKLGVPGRQGVITASQSKGRSKHRKCLISDDQTFQSMKSINKIHIQHKYFINTYLLTVNPRPRTLIQTFSFPMRDYSAMRNLDSLCRVGGFGPGGVGG